jgi:hypothetical protein
VEPVPAVLAGKQVFFNGLGLLQGGVAQRVSLQVLGIHVSLDILHDQERYHLYFGPTCL